MRRPPPDPEILNLRLPRGPEALDQARAALAKVRDLRPAVEDRLALLTTEILEGAVREGDSSPARLELTIRLADTIRVELRSTTPGSSFDTMRMVQRGAISQTLLAHLAHRWGVEPGMIWFELTR